jgi:N-succinyldiaminopimelate aminotransferase
LALGDDYYDDFRLTLQGKRDRLSDGLQALGFDVFVPAGTYFVTTDIRPLGFDDGVDFCLRLPERCGVVAIPHEVFYDDKQAGKPLVRWAFCKQDNVIDAALDRLQRLRS